MQGRAEIAEVNRSLTKTVAVLRETHREETANWGNRVEMLEKELAKEQRVSANAAAEAEAARAKVKQLQHDLQYERYVVAASVGN